MKTRILSLIVIFATTTTVSNAVSKDLYNGIYYNFYEEYPGYTVRWAVVTCENEDSNNPAYSSLASSVSIPTYAIDWRYDNYPVIGIDNYAFRNCSGLRSITIPNSVKSIGLRAFWGCSSLTSITIPNGVESIEYGTFWGCSSLTSITIPNSVKSIDVDAFWGCSSLTSITLPNSVKSIGLSAFQGCNSLTSITIPNSVESIEGSAFWGCSSLTSITLPNSVKSIRQCAFQGCNSLTSITIPNSVKSIESGTFWECSSLTSIIIPDNVICIGGGAFANCENIETVVFGKNVEKIDGDAFLDCSKIYEMTIYAATVPTIDESTFEGVSERVTLYVPKGSAKKYKAHPYWGIFNIVEMEDTGINDIEIKNTPKKFIRDGQVVIQHNGKTYTATGKEIKH